MVQTGQPFHSTADSTPIDFLYVTLTALASDYLSKEKLVRRDSLSLVHI